MVTLCLFKSFLVNLSLSLIKLLGAFLTKSKTLMSDAVHSLSDMTTDIVGLIGSKLSSKKPDINHPFGHGRIEYLTSIIMSILIIILGFGVLINSFNGKIKEFSICQSNKRINYLFNNNFSNKYNNKTNIKYIFN